MSKIPHFNSFLYFRVDTRTALLLEQIAKGHGAPIKPNPKKHSHKCLD